MSIFHAKDELPRLTGPMSQTEFIEPQRAPYDKKTNSYEDPAVGCFALYEVSKIVAGPGWLRAGAFQG